MSGQESVNCVRLVQSLDCTVVEGVINQWSSFYCMKCAKLNRIQGIEQLKDSNITFRCQDCKACFFIIGRSTKTENTT